MTGYLLDTNVVSELRRGVRMDAHVAEWIDRRGKRELFISTVTLAELRRGIALLKRKDRQQAATLERWCDQLQRDFGRAGHLLAIRAAEAAAWGELMAKRPLPTLDGFLAATALVHDLTLATRDVADFKGTPVSVENPFLARG